MAPLRTLHVFVSAAWSSAPRVRELHEKLWTRGDVQIESTWAEKSNGEVAPELCESTSDEDIACAWRSNRDGIIRSHVVIVLGDTPTREGHAEAEYARWLNKAILWVGKPTLSSRMFKYLTFATDDELVNFIRSRDDELRDYISRGHLTDSLRALPVLASE